MQKSREVSLNEPLPLLTPPAPPSPEKGVGGGPVAGVRHTSGEVLQRMGVHVPAVDVPPVPDLPQKISLVSPAHGKKGRPEGT